MCAPFIADVYGNVRRVSAGKSGVYYYMMRTLPHNPRQKRQTNKPRRVGACGRSRCSERARAARIPSLCEGMHASRRACLGATSPRLTLLLSHTLHITISSRFRQNNKTQPPFSTRWGCEGYTCQRKLTDPSSMAHDSRAIVRRHVARDNHFLSDLPGFVVCERRERRGKEKGVHHRTLTHRIIRPIHNTQSGASPPRTVEMTLQCTRRHVS